MDKYITLLRGKKIGLVVNHSSLVNGTHLVDTLISLGIDVQKIFAPEHGFKGTIDAGTKIDDGKDGQTSIKIVSLYGNKYKPDAVDLQGLDFIVFDIQDVGVRFFTYISTLHYIMESCAENNVPLLILDRPNPNGHYIDGPILDTTFRSFVGMDPIPIVYGLTIGELAGMIKGECWIKHCEQLDLEVVRCKNYLHSSKVKLTIKPSPNLPNERSVLLYPSLCLFEGTIVSLGRGTPFPFQAYGHPALKPYASFSFIPISLPEAKNPPLKDSICYGVDLRNIDMNSLYDFKKINLTYLINSYNELKKDSIYFLKNHFFDKLAGTDQLRKQILNKETEATIRKSWTNGIKEYTMRSKKYLLYN